MYGKRNIIILLLITLMLVLLAVTSEKLYFSDFEYHFRTRAFNRILAEKQTIMESCLDDMKPVLAKDDHHGSLSENNIFLNAEENNITLLEYIDNKLIYWSDNEFDVPYLLPDSLYSGPFVFLQNGWFLTKTIKAGNEMLTGLLRIRTEHGFANDIIKNGFEKEFMLSEKVGFSTDRNASEYHVNDKNGNFLFTLLFPLKKEISYLIYVPVLLWILSFISFIILLLQLVKLIPGRIRNYVTSPVLLTCFFILYYIYLKTGQPHIFSLTELFSPYSFSLNSFIPSLGHLLILAFLASLVSYVFYRDFPIPDSFEGKKSEAFLFTIIYLSAGAAITALFHYLFSQLVSTSNISFESYKVLELSWFSFA